jgi:hypothetical protein
MARRVSRPIALRITWVVAPWGVSAHAATIAAWACAVAAAALLAFGTPAGWIAGAVLLQLWYLLDHVDGQLARFHGTSSLDGVQVDYLMHHTTNLLVPLGLGYGLSTRQHEPLWLLAGVVFGLGLLLITLQQDTRYKAFVVRLKRLHGQLLVQGGGGGRPEPLPPIPRAPLRFASWAAHKACEMHVVMNLLTALALGQWLAHDASFLAGRLYVGLMAPLAALVAVVEIVRSVRQGSAEQEFRRWYRPAPGHELTYAEGWWYVKDKGEGERRKAEE